MVVPGRMDHRSSPPLEATLSLSSFQKAQLTSPKAILQSFLLIPILVFLSHSSFLAD